MNNDIYHNVYALIPARGGSTRIKRKNLATIRNKPLISYTIETALNARLFSNVIVNSEDALILSTAKKYGADTYLRPHHLGSGDVFIIEVIQEMINSYQFQDEDIVGILLPTCPLRTMQDIINAYNLFREKGGLIPVVSVSEYETPIQLAQFIGSDNQLQPFFPIDYRKSTRSTDHKKAYRYNEAIIFNTVKNLKQQANLIGERPFPYVMPAIRSIAIDNLYQLDLSKMIITNLENEQETNES